MCIRDRYPDFAAAFLDIDSGRLDGLVVDEILARYYMKKATGKYRALKEDLGKEVVGVGFRKDCLLYTSCSPSARRTRL